MFAFGFTPNQQVTPLIDFLGRSQSARSFYVIAADNAWGRSATAVAANRIREMGGALLATRYSPPKTVDFATDIAAVGAARPDVLIDALEVGDEVAFERQFRSDPHLAGVKVASLSLDATAARSVGPPAVGVFVSQDYNSADPSPATRSWLAELLTRYGDGAIPSAIGAEVFDATLFMASAIGQAQSPTAGAIASAAAGVSIQGPRGSVQVASDAHGYATVSAHIGKVNAAYGVDLLDVSPPIAPNAC